MLCKNFGLSNLFYLRHNLQGCHLTNIAKNLLFSAITMAEFAALWYCQCWSNLKAVYRGTATPLCNSWPRHDRVMKFGPEVALDDTIADTKFQGSGYTGSSGKADTRIVLDQFFQSSQCSKSYHNNFTHKSKHFEAKTRLSLTTKKLNECKR